MVGDSDQAASEMVVVGSSLNRINGRCIATVGIAGALRSPTERGHEFERMRTAIRGNADSDSSERGHFGGIVVTVSAFVGTVSAFVGIVV